MQENSYITMKDIVIEGVVAYLRQNSQSKALSIFWGSSDIIQ